MLPEELTQLLTEIASMSESDEYNLRVSAHIAVRLVENGHRFMPNTIQRSLEDIRHYLSLYKNVDARLRFLYDKMGEWYLRYRPGPRYTENPIYPEQWLGTHEEELKTALKYLNSRYIEATNWNLKYIGIYAGDALAAFATQRHFFWSCLQKIVNLANHVQPYLYGTAQKHLNVVRKFSEGNPVTFQNNTGGRARLGSSGKVCCGSPRRCSCYRNNPIVSKRAPFAEPHWFGDDEIKRVATGQGFTPSEGQAIVKEAGTSWIHTGTDFEAMASINALGRKAIKSYGRPRPPKVGDQVWHMGIVNRANSPKVSNVMQYGDLRIQTDDGAIFDVRQLEAIESPWPPHVPDVNSRILWWDKFR